MASHASSAESSLPGTPSSPRGGGASNGAAGGGASRGNGSASMPDAGAPANGRRSHPAAGARVPARVPAALDRTELVRIIAQAVRGLGYAGSAAALERESGVEAMSGDMRTLRECVLRGLWDELEGTLARVRVFKSEADARAARFVLYEQKFLELLEQGRTADALRCLRGQLTDCAPGPKALHRLPMLHMCRTPAELRRRAEWPGAGVESRMRVLERLRAHIPTDHLLQENRLEALLKQALLLQKRDARFPYTVQASAGLLEDLVHDPRRLPTRALYTLGAHDDEVWFVTFSNNGQYLATGSKDKSVIIWDCARVYAGAVREGDAVLSRLEGHDKDVCFLAWAPDDSRLLSCSWNGITMWDVASGTEVRSFEKHQSQVVAVVWAPNGLSFFSGASDKCIYEWDVATGDTVWKFNTPHPVMDLALSSDGKRLVCCDADRHISVFDTETRCVLRTMSETMFLTSCNLASDDVSLLVNITSNATDQHKNAMDSEMHVWNIETGKLVKKFIGFEQVRFVIRGCFGGFDQQFVLCGSENKLVHVWDRMSGELILRLEGHTKTVNSVAWSPVDPQLFVSGSDDGTVIMWGVDPQLRRPHVQDFPISL